MDEFDSTNCEEFTATIHSPMKGSPLLGQYAPSTTSATQPVIISPSEVILPSIDKKNALWLNVIEQQQQVVQNQELRRQLEARSQAVQKGKKKLTNTITWLTKTKNGIAITTVVVVCILLVLLKPQFVKVHKSNELEEPKLSLGKIILLSLSAGGIVLLVPALHSVFEWIQKKNGKGML